MPNILFFPSFSLGITPLETANQRLLASQDPRRTPDRGAAPLAAENARSPYATVFLLFSASPRRKTGAKTARRRPMALLGSSAVVSSAARRDLEGYRPTIWLRRMRAENGLVACYHRGRTLKQQLMPAYFSASLAAKPTSRSKKSKDASPLLPSSQASVSQ